MYSTIVLFIKALGIFSGFLMLGTFLRAKVPVFQNLYLPASVIGGFIALILGPNVLNILPFSEDVMAIASSLPSVLITPVFAAIPMCLSIRKGDTNAFRKSNDIIIMTFLLGGFFMFQCMLGILAAMGCRLLGINTYDVMGLELAYGFNGGHGMAASLGSALQASDEMRTGLYGRDAELPVMCRQTTVPNSIETLTLHLGLIIAVSAVGYVLEDVLGKIDNIIFASMSAFFYAMIVMLVIWRIICMLGWDHHFNEAVKDKISGTITDFIVVAAIMGINVKILSTYWAALLITCVLGLVVTPLCILMVCKKFLRTNWFEKALGAIGANTGVFVTGILLIKMVDPDIKTDALTDYSVGGTLCNLYAMPMISLAIGIMGSSGPVVALGFAVVTSILCFIPMVLSYMTVGRRARQQDVA